MSQLWGNAEPSIVEPHGGEIPLMLPVRLDAYVNTRLGSFAWGSDYPSGPAWIGGIPFEISMFGGGAGAISLGGRDVTVPLPPGPHDAVFLIMNAAWGIAGAQLGEIVFSGPRGSLRHPLVQGLNVRDHRVDALNNTAARACASATYPDGSRFDVYRYDLSPLDGRVELLQIAIDSVLPAQGLPFLAGVTLCGRGEAQRRRTPPGPRSRIARRILAGSV